MAFSHVSIPEWERVLQAEADADEEQEGLSQQGPGLIWAIAYATPTCLFFWYLIFLAVKRIFNL